MLKILSIHLLRALFPIWSDTPIFIFNHPKKKKKVLQNQEKEVAHTLLIHMLDLSSFGWDAILNVFMQ